MAIVLPLVNPGLTPGVSEGLMIVGLPLANPGLAPGVSDITAVHDFGSIGRLWLLLPSPTVPYRLLPSEDAEHSISV